MAFVIDTNGAAGHTGIVLQNYGNGTIKVMDFNKDGKSGQKSVYDMSINDVFSKGGGFVLNPNAVKQKSSDGIKITDDERKNGLAANYNTSLNANFEDLDPLAQIFHRNDINSDAGFADIVTNLRDTYLDASAEIENEMPNATPEELATAKLNDAIALRDFVKSRNFSNSETSNLFKSIDFYYNKDGDIDEVATDGSYALIAANPTNENAQKVADFLFDVGYTDAELKALFEKLDADGVLNFRWKDGKVVPDPGWTSRFF
jgi:hypothetical protein